MSYLTSVPLTIVPIGKSPELIEYKQTSKNVTGSPTWYTTDNDIKGGALRTAVTSAIGATVKQTREASFSIINELHMYNPTRVIISEISVDSTWSGSGVLDSDVDLFLKNVYGDILVEFKDINSGFEEYQKNSIFPNLDVTGQNQFSIEVLHDVWVGIAGGNDVRTRNMTVKFLFETDTELHSILVRLQDEHGILLYDSHARINGSTYDFLGGQDTIQLPAGDYQIEAWSWIGKIQYVGSESFNVPENVAITVTLKEKFYLDLPDWWWIPAVAIGGLVGLWVVRKYVIGEAKPPILVIK